MPAADDTARMAGNPADMERAAEPRQADAPASPSSDKGQPVSAQAAGQRDAGAGAGLPADALIILPVRNTVLFPGTVFPIIAGRERTILAAQQALREERPVGVLMQRDHEVAEPSTADLHRTGTIANILRYVNGPDGTHHVVLQGEQRFTVTEFLQEQPFIAARVRPIPQPETRTAEI